MINFENQDQSSDMSLNFFGTRIKEVRQNIPTTENVPRMERPKEKEFATIGVGVKRGRIKYVTEKKVQEKKASEFQKENEELQRLVQNMAHTLKEQKESINALQEGYD